MELILLLSAIGLFGYYLHTRKKPHNLTLWVTGSCGEDGVHKCAALCVKMLEEEYGPDLVHIGYSLLYKDPFGLTEDAVGFKLDIELRDDTPGPERNSIVKMVRELIKVHSGINPTIAHSKGCAPHNKDYSL